MQDMKKELIIILLPNNNMVLTTDPACVQVKHHYIVISYTATDPACVQVKHHYIIHSYTATADDSIAHLIYGLLCFDEMRYVGEQVRPLHMNGKLLVLVQYCLLYTSPSPRDS